MSPIPVNCETQPGAGRVIAVVGPSGVGKDSVMQGLSLSEPDLIQARRVITRPLDDTSEAFTSVTDAAFAQSVARGDFCLHWRAHGLRYGIPACIAQAAKAGQGVLLNLSRSVLAQADTVFDDFAVLEVSATPETRAERLAARGREANHAVAARLARSGARIPPGLRCVVVSNDGTLDDAIAQARASLRRIQI